MPGFICEERLAYGKWPAIERMIARLVAHAGFKDVQIVGGSGDQGADIVATRKGLKWVFQAKYQANGSVGDRAGKEAVSALSAYDAKVAVAVSNSDFSPGAFEYQKSTELNGIDLRLWTGARLLKDFSRLPEAHKGYRELRPYQAEAVDKVESLRGSGKRQALVIMATGLGKTIVAETLIVNELRRNPNQEVLVLAHMNDLVRQAEQSIWSQLGKSHSTHLWTDGEKPTYPGGVVFATWQSIYSAMQRGEDLAGRFGLVVVDEAHHAPSTGFTHLLSDLAPNFLLGLTATPWRGDEKRLDEIFGEPCFTMDIVSGMQQGYLAQIEYHMLTDGIDWEEISRLSRQGLTIKDLNHHLLMPDRDLAMVDQVASRMEELGEPRALAFCRSISHAERLRPMFANRGIRTAALHSQLSRQERFTNLANFRSGVIDLLISIEMLNEGIDVPDVNLVAFMRVTHSRRIFLQQLGRGLRIKEGKEKVVVLDFVADIRRIASGAGLNRQARDNSQKQPEIVKYNKDGIIQFDDVSAEEFFDEYLADVADIENFEDGARLKFPGDEVF
jgi:superfamily II DNA or RNA helicase